MTNKEALQAFAHKGKLDQSTIKRLLRAGLIEASDITTLDTPGGERVYLPTAITMKGQRLMEN
jgi:hypothetical protein